ncbi:MAG: hypothetical protein ACP5UR_17035 [Chloroflexus sp.]|uniref:hypothetical protein n=1 Tax=Chloroflexus sp. TaxID=1904827 RepID=UPI003D138191
MKALYWNGGAKLTAWRLIHDVERLVVNAMTTPHLKAWLHRTLGDLPEFPLVCQVAWKKNRSRKREGM